MPIQTSIAIMGEIIRFPDKTCEWCDKRYSRDDHEEYRSLYVSKRGIFPTAESWDEWTRGTCPDCFAMIFVMQWDKWLSDQRQAVLGNITDGASPQETRSLARLMSAMFRDVLKKVLTDARVGDKLESLLNEFDEATWKSFPDV